LGTGNHSLRAQSAREMVVFCSLISGMQSGKAYWRAVFAHPVKRRAGRNACGSSSRIIWRNTAAVTGLSVFSKKTFNASFIIV